MTGRRRWWRVWGLASAFVAGAMWLAGAGAAVAQGGPHPDNLRDREVIQTAYHEPSDTYFQLVSDVVDKTGTGKWRFAVTKARRASHEGRQGRLARIGSAERHQWLIESFDLDALPGAPGIWIGLRYWCGMRMLTWADGDELKPGAFHQPWSTPWHLSDIKCGSNKIAYMGVFYDRRNGRWRAAGPKKRFRYYLIEYPPAKEMPQQQEATR